VILRVGAHGTHVMVLQRHLHIAVSWHFGKRTLRAVRQFQRKHHLLVDGQVGPHTWRALLHGHSRHQGRKHHHRHHHIHHRAPGELRLGAHGATVAHLQSVLGIRADGVFGPATLAAVIRFQRDHRLGVDGIVGPATWAALSHVRPSLGERAVRLALTQRGVAYRWGGATPGSGFDCSGLVYWVYHRLGVPVPRVTYAQWWAGHHIRRWNLRPGDLVFFHRLGHVGIWLGNGQFVHAPSTGQVVHISRLDGWFAAHYNGAVHLKA
jgi:peptidoglycan DL-endopeptidase CwlO